MGADRIEPGWLLFDHQFQSARNIATSAEQPASMVASTAAHAPAARPPERDFQSNPAKS
jgi:hypothetical protein